MFDFLSFRISKLLTHLRHVPLANGLVFNKFYFWHSVVFFRQLTDCHQSTKTQNPIRDGSRHNHEARKV
jgi:hypothetical protein